MGIHKTWGEDLQDWERIYETLGRGFVRIHETLGEYS